MENPSHEVQVEDNEEAGTSKMSAIAERRWVTTTLLVAMMVTAMEQLVVSPAMPTIIAQLKGFDIYPWVISAFLLAATVSTPIYGKLADLFGANGSCSSDLLSSVSVRFCPEPRKAWRS